MKLDLPADNFNENDKLIKNLFHEYGINSATVQPEFVSGNVNETTRRRFSTIEGDVNEPTVSLDPANDTKNRSNNHQGFFFRMISMDPLLLIIVLLILL